MDELVKQILSIGLLPTILLVVIYLIVQDPTRAEKLKAIIIWPFFAIGKWFSKSYISSEVASTVNQFLKSNILSYLINDPKTAIKVDWVRKAKDPIFSKDGNIIIRLKQDDDQTKNILNATQVALPRIVCPLVRSNLNQAYGKAIDLALMQRLSEKIGRHGKSIYKRYFLDPETKEDQTLGELISKLIELDNHGFFVPVLLNELELVGEGLFANSDSKDYTSEAIQFVEYLLTLVNRERGSEIELNYFNPPFALGSMLLAVAHRADIDGLRPYLKRLRIKIEKGCESIYVIAYPNAFKFFDRLIKSIDGHESLNIEKVINTIDYAGDPSKKNQHFRIAILSYNQIFGEQVFRDRVEANNLKVGLDVKGTVDDISEKEALVNVAGLRTYIRRQDCSWLINNSCSDHLIEGEEYDFKIKSIDDTTGTVYLTRKLDKDNPWKNIEIPEIGSSIEVKIIGSYNTRFVSLYKDALPVYIPYSEISWHYPTNEELQNLLNKTITVEVKSHDVEHEEIIASKKMLEENPWPEIHKAYPVGTEFNGKITEITEFFVRVDIGDSVYGIVPKEALLKAGFEYANYQENLVKGQGLDVVITKVFISKQKIRLDLKRNQTAL